MDEEQVSARRTIALLCVKAGTLMEDASVDAVSILPSDTHQLVGRLSKLSAAGRYIHALLEAAVALANLELPSQ